MRETKTNQRLGNGQIITSAFPAVVFLLPHTYLHSLRDPRALTHCQFIDRRLKIANNFLVFSTGCPKKTKTIEITYC